MQNDYYAAIQFALMGCGDKCLIFICFRLVLSSAFCDGKGVIKFLRLRVASKTMHQKVAGGISANADWKFFHGKHFHLQDVIGLNHVKVTLRIIGKPYLSDENGNMIKIALNNTLFLK